MADAPKPGDDLPALRPAEALRAQVIEALGTHFAHDRLTLDEYEQRVDRVYAARSANDLRLVLEGLPVQESQLPVAAAAASAPVPSSSTVPESRTLFALWSGNVRRGTWVVPRRLRAIALMGGVEIDLRDTPLPPEGVDIFAVAVMGGIEIKVPPGVRLETDGVAILGGFEDQLKGPASLDPAAPLVRVTGFALMGGVAAKVGKRR